MDFAHVANMVNNLQRVCYQVRFLEWQREDLDSEWLLTIEDKDSLAELIVPSVFVTNEQLYKIALLERGVLIESINESLSKNNATKSFRLEPVKDELYRISITGGIEDIVKIEFVGCDSFKNVIEMSEKSNSRYIFLGQRDFGELEAANPDLNGEYWVLRGDDVLSAIFWPFLLPLDATCFSINDPTSFVLDVEGSEK
jgi:hypothetical protein